MKIETAEDAIEAYTGQDAWQFADREAAWEWMFEAGRKSAMNTCYRLAMAASDDAGFDLSALPEKAADEIKRMRELADSEGTRAVEYLRRARKSEANVARLMLEEEGAKDAFAHVVQQKHDADAECKRLRGLLDSAYADIRRMGQKA